MEILKQFTAGGVKLNAEFLDGWKHYKQIGLPPIECVHIHSTLTARI